MLINNPAIVSSLYDMYKVNAFTPFSQEGQRIISMEMWQRHWHIKTKTLNYLKGSGSEPFWKNLTLRCLRLIDYVGYYMVGEFDAHNDEFIEELWPVIIKAWYFGKLWVIKSDVVKQQEIMLAESDIYRDKVPEHKLYRDNPYRLFELQNFKDGKYYFRSLLTGITDFEIDPKEMVYLSLNEGLNFIEWWRINMEFVSGRSRVVDSLKALSKTVLVVVRNQNAYDNEREQIENPSVFYELQRQAGTQGTGSTEQNLYQHMPVIDGQRIRDMQDVVQSLYEKDCEFLGVTMNSNDKKERLTAGENYKDLRRITNLQDWQLKSLKTFEARLKRKGWVEKKFRIEISGLAFAQGLPDTVLTGGQNNFQASPSFGAKPKPAQQESDE